LVDEFEVRHDDGGASTGEGKLEDGAVFFGEVEVSIDGNLG